MMGTPTSGTRVFAVLGDPVGHSRSPIFQNAAFRAASVDGVYVALRCRAGELPCLLRALARAGGGGNVTAPHKQAAARAVDRRTETVERSGACNTFWLQEGEVWGDNTDVAGFVAAATALLPRPLAGLRILVLGAGGVARSVLCALIDGGVREVVILNRTAARADALVDHFQEESTALRSILSAGEVAGERFDLAVNSTALGLRPGDPLPLAPDAVEIAAALDLVYLPGQTPWVHALGRRGIPAADGKEMLLHQGAAAFERWWSVPAPLQAMREALDLGGDPG